MKKMLIISSVFLLAGCASLVDAPKNIMGISTRDLDEARVHAAAQDLHADLADVFSAVVDIAKERKYYIFSKDESRGLIVLMNIPGCVDTTEVGVYLSSLEGGDVRVEVASRSTPAQVAVAEHVLADLEVKFKKV